MSKTKGTMVVIKGKGLYTYELSEDCIVKHDLVNPSPIDIADILMEWHRVNGPKLIDRAQKICSCKSEEELNALTSPEAEAAFYASLNIA